MCPTFDHRGNEKVERLIRTVNERLRGNPELLAERQKQLFYQLVVVLRSSKGKDGKSSFERHTGRKRNTITSILVKQYKELIGVDYYKQWIWTSSKIFRDDDSTIFVRERQRKRKLAGLF